MKSIEMHVSKMKFDLFQEFVAQHVTKNLFSLLSSVYCKDVLLITQFNGATKPFRPLNDSRNLGVFLFSIPRKHGIDRIVITLIG